MKAVASVSSATFWSVLEVALGQGLRFVITVVLARLLTPEEFGTIALLSLFVAVGGAFVESGLGAALIHRQELIEEDRSTVFWFNITAAFLVACLLALGSPVISSYLGKPILIPLTMVFAVNIMISAMGTVHRALFTKQLEFKPLMLIGACATFVSGACAIGMAAAGLGIWALAAQVLIAEATTSTLLWVMSPWRPKLLFSRKAARELFGYGGYVLASSLLDILYTRGYTLLIGKFYSTQELGQFARAETTAALPTKLMTTAIARVAFPALANISEDKQRVRNAMQLGLQATMLLNAPAMLGLAAVAKPFVLGLYGAKWLPAVELLQILCFSGLLMPFHMLNVQLLMALGRSNLIFKLEVLKKVMGVAILIFATSFGPVGIAWGIVLSSIVALVINTSQTRKLIGYGTWLQIRDVAATMLLAAAMAGLVSWLVYVLPTSPLITLGIGVAAGVLFQALVLIFVRPPALELLLKRWLKKKEDRVA